jgi:ketosteroid isomerase-like protein
MSEENTELVRRVYEVIVSRLDPPPELFHPEFELDARQIGSDFPVVRGPEAALRALRPYHETFDEFHIDVEAVIHADGSHVVTSVRDRGRIKESGAVVSNSFFHVWTFRGGRVACCSIHLDRAKALASARVPE